MIWCDCGAGPLTFEQAVAHLCTPAFYCPSCPDRHSLTDGHLVWGDDHALVRMVPA